MNDYLSVIHPKAVMVDVEAKNKEEVFAYASKLLLEAGVLTNAEGFKEDLYYRESLGVTGIGGGVAIPHGKSKYVENTCIAVLKLKDYIQWETVDEKPVKVLIMFAVKEEDKTNSFLKMMAQVARKLASEEVCKKLMSAHTPAELIEALS